MLMSRCIVQAAREEVIDPAEARSACTYEICGEFGGLCGPGSADTTLRGARRGTTINRC